MKSFNQVKLDFANQKMQQKDYVLTVSEAKQLLNVSGETLRRYSEKGMLSYQKSEGGHRKYSREELLSFTPKKQHQKIMSIIVVVLCCIPLMAIGVLSGFMLVGIPN